MGRHKKNPEDRKSYHLRVPLNDAQRSLIEEVCRANGQDLAAWSRAVLLDAAQRFVKKSGKNSGAR